MAGAAMMYAATFLLDHGWIVVAVLGGIAVATALTILILIHRK